MTQIRANRFMKTQSAYSVQEDSVEMTQSSFFIGL